MSQVPQDIPVPETVLRSVQNLFLPGEDFKSLLNELKYALNPDIINSIWVKDGTITVVPKSKICSLDRYFPRLSKEESFKTYRLSEGEQFKTFISKKSEVNTERNVSDDFSKEETDDSSDNNEKELFHSTAIGKLHENKKFLNESKVTRKKKISDIPRRIDFSSSSSSSSDSELSMPSINRRNSSTSKRSNSGASSPENSKKQPPSNEDIFNKIPFVENGPIENQIGSTDKKYSIAEEKQGDSPSSSSSLAEDERVFSRLLKSKSQVEVAHQMSSARGGKSLTIEDIFEESGDEKYVKKLGVNKAGGKLSKNKIHLEGALDEQKKTASLRPRANDFNSSSTSSSEGEIDDGASKSTNNKRESFSKHSSSEGSSNTPSKKTHNGKTNFINNLSVMEEGSLEHGADAVDESNLIIDESNILPSPMVEENVSSKIVSKSLDNATHKTLNATDDEPVMIEEINGNSSKERSFEELELRKHTSDDDMIQPSQDPGVSRFNLSLGRKTSSPLKSLINLRSSDKNASDDSSVESLDCHFQNSPGWDLSEKMSKTRIKKLKAKLVSVIEIPCDSGINPLNIDSFTPEDDLFLIQCPTEVDPKLLIDKEIVLSGASRITLGDPFKPVMCDYFTIEEKSQRLVDILLPNLSRTCIQIGRFPLSGNTILSASIYGTESTIKLSPLKKGLLSPSTSLNREMSASDEDDKTESGTLKLSPLKKGLHSPITSLNKKKSSVSDSQDEAEPGTPQLSPLKKGLHSPIASLSKKKSSASDSQDEAEPGTPKLSPLKKSLLTPIASLNKKKSSASDFQDEAEPGTPKLSPLKKGLLSPNIYLKKEKSSEQEQEKYRTSELSSREERYMKPGISSTVSVFISQKNDTPLKSTQQNSNVGDSDSSDWQSVYEQESMKEKKKKRFALGHSEGINLQKFKTPPGSHSKTVECFRNYQDLGKYSFSEKNLSSNEQHPEYHSVFGKIDATLTHQERDEVAEVLSPDGQLFEDYPMTGRNSNEERLVDMHTGTEEPLPPRCMRRAAGEEFIIPDNEVPISSSPSRNSNSSSNRGEEFILPGKPYTKPPIKALSASFSLEMADISEEITLSKQQNSLFVLTEESLLSPNSKGKKKHEFRAQELNPAVSSLDKDKPESQAVSDEFILPENDCLSTSEYSNTKRKKNKKKNSKAEPIESIPVEWAVPVNDIFYPETTNQKKKKKRRKNLNENPMDDISHTGFPVNFENFQPEVGQSEVLTEFVIKKKRKKKNKSWSEDPLLHPVDKNLQRILSVDSETPYLESGHCKVSTGSVLEEKRKTRISLEEPNKNNLPPILPVELETTCHKSSLSSVLNESYSKKKKKKRKRSLEESSGNERLSTNEECPLIVPSSDDFRSFKKKKKKKKYNSEDSSKNMVEGSANISTFGEEESSIIGNYKYKTEVEFVVHELIPDIVNPDLSNLVKKEKKKKKKLKDDTSSVLIQNLLENECRKLHKNNKKRKRSKDSQIDPLAEIGTSEQTVPEFSSQLDINKQVHKKKKKLDDYFLKPANIDYFLQPSRMEKEFNVNL